MFFLTFNYFRNGSQCGILIGQVRKLRVNWEYDVISNNVTVHLYNASREDK